MTLHEIFASLGLSDRETSVFLKMLDTGPQTVGMLAKSLDIPRSTAQFVVDKLVEMNLLQEFEGSGVKMYRCVSPRDILKIFNQKKTRLQEAMEEYTQDLPELEKMGHKEGPMPGIMWQEGKEAITQRLVYISSRHKEKETQRIMHNPEVLNRVAPHLFDKNEYEESNTVYEELVVDTPFAREYKEMFKDVKGVNIQLLPPSFNFTSDVSVIGDELRMCVLEDSESDFLYIRLKNAQLATQVEQMLVYLQKSLKKN